MRRLLIILCCFALVACYGTGRKGGGEALAIHDFGPPAERLADSGGLAGFAFEVRAPLWFDSLGIGYRLLYADPSRLRDYTRARWAGPPAQLVQQRLMQKLPLVPHGQARTRCVLRIEIDEFSQLFAAPGESRGVLQGRLIALDRSRGKVDWRDLRIEKPAPSGDSLGAVLALTATVDALAVEIVGWEREERAAGRLGGCAG
jgi:ABC-type uncharacterized transport system auxiliary subunit